MMNSRKVVAEISIIPVGTGSSSVSQYVAACIEMLSQKKELVYRLSPMSTIIEGTMRDILEAVQEMHNIPFSKGALRVVTTVKIDDRIDKTLSMDGKLESVRIKYPEVQI